MYNSQWLNFQDQVVVITGGRRGIGGAFSKAFAEAGARVAVIGKSENAGEIAEFFEKNNQELFYIQADISIRKDRDKIIPAVIDHFGRINILINNAGAQKTSSIADYTPEQWDNEMSLMLTAPFELAKQAGFFMCRQRSGKIINIASISSFQGARNIIGCSTAKHGIVGLTKCLADEFAPFQVNVNAIAPGLVRTGMSAEVFLNSERAEVLRSRIPDGHFAEPEDLIGSVFFLSSPMSSHIHGHVLLVDGGWMGR